MPVHYTSNHCDFDTLNIIANKIKFYQQHFVRQNFIEPDQENWIDFKLHQNGESSLMDFVYDITIQHNWLAENVIQLVEEVDKQN